MKIKFLLVLAVLILGAIPASAQQTDLKIEVYIPTGMPIQIQVRRDESVTDKVKYLIERTVGPEVDRVQMFMLVRSEEAKQGNGMLVWTNKRVSTASTSWPLEKKVDRLLVMVKRVETDEGVWLIDAPDSIAEMSMVVEHSDTSLMSARFVKLVKVETYIPAGMEKLIKFDVFRDEKETLIMKYRYFRRISDDVLSASIAVILVGVDGKILHSSQYTTDRLTDPAEVAWAQTADVRRLIIVIERLDTKEGSWTLDAEDLHINKVAIVERGMNALPAAKFVKR